MSKRMALESGIIGIGIEVLSMVDSVKTEINMISNNRGELNSFMVAIIIAITLVVSAAMITSVILISMVLGVRNVCLEGIKTKDKGVQLFGSRSSRMGYDWC